MHVLALVHSESRKTPGAYEARQRQYTTSYQTILYCYLAIKYSGIHQIWICYRYVGTMVALEVDTSLCWNGEIREVLSWDLQGVWYQYTNSTIQCNTMTHLL